MRTNLLFILCILAFYPIAYGLSDTSKVKFEPYLFMDIYYVYNFHNPDGNTLPSFVYNYNGHNEFAVNTSLFWGKEKAEADSVTDIANRRSFFDFYGIFQFTNQWSTTLYVDLGFQRITCIEKDANRYAITGMSRYKPTPKLALCQRVEHYQDEFGVMVPTHIENGFVISSTSLNIDYLLTEKVLARIEGKTFLTKDNIIVKDNNSPSAQTYIIATSLSMKF
jgi:hypothetical protein